jgi:hypothetical protein
MWPHARGQTTRHPVRTHATHPTWAPNVVIRITQPDAKSAACWTPCANAAGITRHHRSAQLVDEVVAELLPHLLKVPLKSAHKHRVGNDHHILLVALHALHRPIEAAIQKEAAINDCKLVVHVERAVVCDALDTCLRQAMDVASLRARLQSMPHCSGILHLMHSPAFVHQRVHVVVMLAGACMLARSRASRTLPQQEGCQTLWCDMKIISIDSDPGVYPSSWLSSTTCTRGKR